MWEDEVLDAIHKIREEHARSFNYDLAAMFADWQRRQADGGREVVSLPPKLHPLHHHTAIDVHDLSGNVGGGGIGS
jgi:hypothetical protein